MNLNRDYFKKYSAGGEEDREVLVVLHLESSLYPSMFLELHIPKKKRCS